MNVLLYFAINTGFLTSTCSWNAMQNCHQQISSLYFMRTPVKLQMRPLKQHFHCNFNWLFFFLMFMHFINLEKWILQKHHYRTALQFLMVKYDACTEDVFDYFFPLFLVGLIQPFLTLQILVPLGQDFSTELL